MSTMTTYEEKLIGVQKQQGDSMKTHDITEDQLSFRMGKVANDFRWNLDRTEKEGGEVHEFLLDCHGEGRVSTNASEGDLIGLLLENGYRLCFPSMLRPIEQEDSLACLLVDYVCGPCRPSKVRDDQRWRGILLLDYLVGGSGVEDPMLMQWQDYIASKFDGIVSRFKILMDGPECSERLSDDALVAIREITSIPLWAEGDLI